MAAGAPSFLRRAVAALLILAFGAVVLWAAIGVTLTMTVGRSNPELALRWWPWGAAPKAALAARIAADVKAPPADLARAEQLAREALLREPVNVEAARALAMLRARENKLDAANRLFVYAEKLSRRDLPTQLWLIEHAVQNEDIPGALKHYDRALRTSRTAPDILLPVLVAAADDPAIVQPLVRTLAPRPHWWRQFMTLAMKDIKNGKALVSYARSLKLEMSNAEDKEYIVRVVDRLTRDRLYDDALAYYGDVTGTPAAKLGLVRNGGFEGPNTGLPFDWWLREEPGLTADMELFGDDTHLVLRAGRGRGGDLAKQLLVLKPGTYQISGRVGDTGQDKLEVPSIVFACVGGASLLDRPLPFSGEEGAPFSYSFTVLKPGCQAQWLSIRAAPAAEMEAWIDGIEVRPSN